MDFTRRALIAATGASAGAAMAQSTGLVDLRLPGGPGVRPLAPRFPQKGEMIVQRVRPPLLETPFAVFDKDVLTPNDRHFVRWSWSHPTLIDAAAHRLVVRGAVKTPLSLTLAELVRLGETVEFAAVNQCAGNGRGFHSPRVIGTQWANGAMSNAKWRGVRLRDVLDKAGIAADAKHVRFKGLDTPLVDGAPHYMKSLPVAVARRDDTILAYAMNGEALPVLNGFPLRLVVPGWFSTYWVKMLSDIEVLTQEDDSYFMTKTYRWPTVPVQPGDKDFPTVPIAAMPPRSFVTSHADGATVARGSAVDLRGIAFGGDLPVKSVSVMVDGAAQEAFLVPDDTKHGFRRWTLRLPRVDRDVEIAVRCTNAVGIAQPDAPLWNPSGYAMNAVERILLVVA